MDYRVILLLAAYGLEITSVALDGTWYELKGQFSWNKLVRGAVREMGFCIGMAIVFIASTLLPEGLIVIGSLGMAEIVEFILIGYLVVVAEKFVKKAVELKNIKIDEIN